MTGIIYALARNAELSPQPQTKPGEAVLPNSFIDPQKKLFANLGRIALLQEGGVPAPINVEIDLSNRCSLGCEWCH
jgi:hypothetical protein